MQGINTKFSVLLASVKNLNTFVLWYYLLLIWQGSTHYSSNYLHKWLNIQVIARAYTPPFYFSHFLLHTLRNHSHLFMISFLLKTLVYSLWKWDVLSFSSIFWKENASFCLFSSMENSFKMTCTNGCFKYSPLYRNLGPNKF